MSKGQETGGNDGSVEAVVPCGWVDRIKERGEPWRLIRVRTLPEEGVKLSSSSILGTPARGSRTPGGGLAGG